jgi:lactobin A/cerein 7B family class IIb bacteriocin
MMFVEVKARELEEINGGFVPILAAIGAVSVVFWVYSESKNIVAGFKDGYKDGLRGKR